MNPRSAAPNTEPNNQDLFVWALYVLGGADNDIDVEAVYLKSFELAPARLGWRTRPDLPDYKKTAKALQSVESTTHVGLIAKRGPYGRRLTPDGVRWVERFRPVLEGLYGGEGAILPPATNTMAIRRTAVRASEQFASWVRGDSLDLVFLAEALECSPSSPNSVWRARLDELQRVAEVTGDAQLGDFATAVGAFLAEHLPGGGSV